MISRETLLHFFPDLPNHRRTEGDQFNLTIETQKLRLKRRSHENRLFKQRSLEKPSLVSSCEGSIDSILFSFPSWAVNDAKYSNAYTSLINAMSKNTKFVVVANSTAQPMIKSWFANAGHDLQNITFSILSEFVRFSDWAEDAYVSVIDKVDGSLHLIEPWNFMRGGDALIADAVENISSITALQVPLMFQGGNCLVGDSFWLMGRDYIYDTIELFEEDRSPVLMPKNVDPEKFTKSMFSTFIDNSREFVVLGDKKQIPLNSAYGKKSNGKFYIDFPTDGTGTYQPIFHIDMFVTLLGKNSEGAFEAFVGSPKLADDVLKSESLYALQETYDLIAQQLIDEGIKVTRNPLVHWPSEGRSFTLKQLKDLAINDYPWLLSAISELETLGAKDVDNIISRNWHHITWNNCLIENDGQKRKVYLPTFGYGKYSELSKIDETTKNLFEAHGFEVSMLGDFNPFAERSGVVHCISKYLNRGTFQELIG